MTPQDILSIGRKTLHNEAETLLQMERSLDERFIEAVDLIYECRGKVIVTGMGKSGIIAHKIAAMLTSTGTPALFLHPAEALHGDLGIISKGDILLALSHSGQTEEVCRVVDYASSIGNSIVALTSHHTSRLASSANITLCTEVESEDCLLNIVPTASTTAHLALGDAIATALMYKRNFHLEDFRRLHPEGITVNKKE
ncbi:MAG: SIS domain-containing protein [Alistipes sp.]|nr:SIS domain-containing protein [Alistipes sp.]